MKKRQSLSQKVLDKKQKEFNQAISTFCKVSLVLIALVLSGFVVHTERKRLALVKAPTWAGFSIIDGLNERISATHPDGVPISLMINGQEWSVVQVDHFDDDVGPSASIEAETYCPNQTIAYIPSDDEQVLKVNLMHEVFHAGDCLHGGDGWWNSEHPTGTVHPGIYHLGEFTAMFLHDNPQFAKWEAQ